MRSKDLDFEINLLPVISLLAVLICFSLLTTAWIHIESVDVAQGVGGQSDNSNNEKPEILVSINSSGVVQLKVSNIKKLKKHLSSFKVKNINSRYQRKRLSRYLKKINKYDVSQVLVSPEARTPYKSLITLLDTLRKNKFKNIGVNPI